MNKIDCEVFRPGTKGTSAFVQALNDLNKWKDGNSTFRVLNVETIVEASGGESVYGDAVRLHAVGLRVWFERN